MGRRRVGTRDSVHDRARHRSGCGRGASRSAARPTSGAAPRRASATSIFAPRSLTGAGVDWPLEYEEIAPYYSRVERMIGVASTVQNRPSNPDGEYLPAVQFPLPRSHPAARARRKIGVPYLPDRIAQLTRDHEGSPACHFCGACTTGCDTGSFFSTPWRFLPRAEATNNLELRTDALAKNILVDENGLAQRRCLHRSQHRAGSRSARARGRRRGVVP